MNRVHRMMATIERAREVGKGETAADQRMAAVLQEVVAPVQEWLDLGNDKGRKDERMKEAAEEKEDNRPGIEWKGVLEELGDLVKECEEERLRDKAAKEALEAEMMEVAKIEGLDEL